MMWITFECMLFMCTYCFWSRFVCICYLYTTHPMINVIAWQSIEISCLNRSKMSIYLDLLSWRVELGTDSWYKDCIQWTVWKMESSIILLGLHSLKIEVFHLRLYQKLMSFLFWTVSVFGPCWYKWLGPGAEPAEKCHVSKENHPSEPGSDTRGHSGYHDNYDNRKTKRSEAWSSCWW